VQEGAAATLNTGDNSPASRFHAHDILLDTAAVGAASEFLPLEDLLGIRRHRERSADIEQSGGDGISVGSNCVPP